jgi:predicted dehydrogenase
MLTIGLIGAGYWGKNLIRVFGEHPGAHLAAVIEQRAERREALRRRDPRIFVGADAGQILDDPAIDAVVIATQAASHYDLARRALDRGKHVLVEKPMCRSSDEAADLVARAARCDRVLMVDHTFLFHPAVIKLAALARSGALGAMSYYDSQRINLGLFQPDVNVLWDLGPHDLAILDVLFGEQPIHVEATGYCHLNPDLPDIAYVSLHFPSSRVAHLNLSWMSPVKVRRIAIGGSEKMAVWDDLDRDEPVKIYDSGIGVLPQGERDVILPSYRVGDVSSPRLAGTEPLASLADHFLHVIAGVEASRADGGLGLRVVRMLERAQAALDASLRRVRQVRPADGLVGAQ